MTLIELIKTVEPGKERDSLIKEYNNLFNRSEKLEALEQGGVDNWDGYGWSLEDYFGEDDMEEEWV